MRCLTKASATLLAIFFLAAGILLMSASMAATLEDAYIAARDAAIAKIKTDEAVNHGPMSSISDKIIDEDIRALASLQRKMSAIVGPVAIKDMTGEPKINLDTLIEGNEGFGLLDGMIFGAVDAKTRVIVTTDSMFWRWLRQHKNWWGKDFEIPQEPSVAVKENNFYVMLASRAQSEAPSKANEIFVAVARGTLVFARHDALRIAAPPPRRPSRIATARANENSCVFLS